MGSGTICLSHTVQQEQPQQPLGIFTDLKVWPLALGGVLMRSKDALCQPMSTRLHAAGLTFCRPTRPPTRLACLRPTAGDHAGAGAHGVRRGRGRARGAARARRRGGRRQ
eukprot:356410-Chlamydomonas_euryale.AAC.1